MFFPQQRKGRGGVGSSGKVGDGAGGASSQGGAGGGGRGGWYVTSSIIISTEPIFSSSAKSTMLIHATGSMCLI